MMAKRTVLITGCTKGTIGYSLANLSSTPNITLLPLDVTSRESILAAHAQIRSETGEELDIMYHNAGYRSLGMAIEASAEEVLKMFNTNLFGILYVNEIFANMVIKAKGMIVITGSVTGYTPHPSSSVYAASKAAVSMYAETLRIEMKPFGVKVVHVATAAVNTGMSAARLELSENSNYRYFEAAINKAWADLETRCMDPDIYARKVVAQLTKPNPLNEIWCGTGSLTVRIIQTLGFRWLYAWGFSRMYGLNRIAPVSMRNSIQAGVVAA